MAFERGLDKSEVVYNQFDEISSVLAKLIKDDFIFTWQWWFGVALFIIPWILWFKFKKKDSTGCLLLAGMLTIILSLIIDLVALSLGLWSYPMVIVPLAPFLFLPYHFSLAPVAIMFALQVKPKMNHLLKGVIFSAIAAFVGMNFFDAIGFYNPKNWSTLYDFFIYLSLYYAAFSVSKIDCFQKLDSEN